MEKSIGLCSFFVLKGSLYLLFLTYFNIAVGQELAPFTDLQKGKYNWGNKTSILLDFEEEFKYDERANLLFQNFNKARKLQKTVNIVGLGVVGAGLLTAIIATEIDPSISYESLGFWGTASLTSTFLGNVAIIGGNLSYGITSVALRKNNLL